MPRFNTPFSLAGWLFIAGLLVLLILLGRCALDARGDAREARGDQRMAEGRTTSAVEAITAIDQLGQRADATETEVKEAQNAIRQADPADRDRVFRHRVCILQHRSDCDRLFGTRPADPDARHAAR